MLDWPRQPRNRTGYSKLCRQCMRDYVKLKQRDRRERAAAEEGQLRGDGIAYMALDKTAQDMLQSAILAKTPSKLMREMLRDFGQRYRQLERSKTTNDRQTI